MPIQYYLQPNPITPDPNDRSARVATTETLNQEDIIKEMLQRGTLLTETDITAVLNLYNTVIADRIADGRSVTTPVVNLRPSIRGVFKDANDVFDSSRHTLRASATAGLQVIGALRDARVEKTTSGLPGPSIAVYEDINSGTQDAVLTPGGIGKIVGEELKFDASQSDEGIFFIGADGVDTRVAVIASATEGQLMFMVPALAAGDYTLEVRRAYTNSRSIRRGTLDHTLTVGASE